MDLHVGDRVAVDALPERTGTVEDVVPGHGFHIRWDDGPRTLWSPYGVGLRRLEDDRDVAEKAEPAGRA
jgi:hypothetical protein